MVVGKVAMKLIISDFHRIIGWQGRGVEEVRWQHLIIRDEINAIARLRFSEEGLIKCFNTRDLWQ